VSESPPMPSPEPVTPEKPGGFLQTLIDVYFAPREAFTRIVARPTWVLPVVCATVLSLAFTGLWLQRVDMPEFVKTQIQEQGQWDRIPAERRDAVIEQQAKIIPITGWVGGVVGPIILYALMAGVLLFIYKFFYAGELGFKQSLSITAWSMFPVGLLTTPLMALIMWLKEDWNLNPQNVLQANLSLLLDKAETAKPLWALATSLDLISFWIIFLLATGFGVAVKKKTGSALWGILIPWALMVAIKVGWSAIF
jgi:hypothetical protein